MYLNEWKGAENWRYWMDREHVLARIRIFPYQNCWLPPRLVSYDVKFFPLQSCLKDEDFSSTKHIWQGISVWELRFELRKSLALGNFVSYKYRKRWSWNFRQWLVETARPAISTFTLGSKQCSIHSWKSFVASAFVKRAICTSETYSEQVSNHWSQNALEDKQRKSV